MATNILLAVFVFFCVPETKKVALEEMDHLFGGVNQIEKGAGIMFGGDDTQGKDNITEARQAENIELR